MPLKTLVSKRRSRYHHISIETHKKLIVKAVFVPILSANEKAKGSLYGNLRDAVVSVPSEYMSIRTGGWDARPGITDVATQ